jgi:hypothetical protein
MKSHLELFRRLESEIRTPKERLPIDAFLPAVEALPTQFPDPPPSKIPVQSREVGGSEEDDEARRQRRKVRREKKPAPADPSQPIKLEDEIQEFMNRDKKEGTNPDEIAEFLGGYDPTEVPES